MANGYRGTTLITDIRHGSTAITEVRHGSIPVWQRNVKRDDFDAEDLATLSADWTDCGPSNDYKLGVLYGYTRVRLPEGMIGGLFDQRTSRYRYNKAVASADDGYIEARLATRGDSGSLLNMQFYDFTSEVFGRLSNGGFTHGVGFSAAGGHLWITRLVSGNFTRVVECGTFQPNDRVRVTFVGNLHTLYVNGVQRGQWNDASATAAKGAGYRSLGIVGQAGKDLLGPRRYSPGIDYVLMA